MTERTIITAAFAAWLALAVTGEWVKRREARLRAEAEADASHWYENAERMR